MNDWVYVAKSDDFPRDAGACVKFGDEQIAVFNYGKREWYAVQNLCPHNQQMVLSRGLLGDCDGEAKVSCPLHKNSFLLKTGEHIGGREDFKLKTFAVKHENGAIYLSLDTANLSGAIAAGDGTHDNKPEAVGSAR